MTITPSQQATLTTETTATTEGLIALAHAHGICIYWRRLHPGRRGLWDARTRSIWIDPGLSDRGARSLLAHELGHAALGHAGPQPPARERDAWEWAARRLIHPSDYALAEYEHGPHLGAIAEDLDLSMKVVTAYQRTLERIAA